MILHGVDVCFLTILGLMEAQHLVYVVSVPLKTPWTSQTFMHKRKFISTSLQTAYIEACGHKGRIAIAR